MNKPFEEIKEEEAEYMESESEKKQSSKNKNCHSIFSNQKEDEETADHINENEELRSTSSKETDAENTI